MPPIQQGRNPITIFFFQIIRYIPFQVRNPLLTQKLRWDQEHYQGGVGYQPTVGWQYQPTAHATNRTEPTQAGSNHARPSLCPISKTNPFSSSASNDRAPNSLMRSVFSGGHFPFLAEDYLFLSRLHSGTFFCCEWWKWSLPTILKNYIYWDVLFGNFSMLSIEKPQRSCLPEEKVEKSWFRRNRNVLFSENSILSGVRSASDIRNWWEVSKIDNCAMLTHPQGPIVRSVVGRPDLNLSRKLFLSIQLARVTAISKGFNPY